MRRFKFPVEEPKGKKKGRTEVRKTYTVIQLTLTATSSRE
jgi:hypothetical protein